MQKRDGFARGLRVLGAVALMTAMSGAAEARDFRSADVHPADYPTVKAVEYLGKLVTERSGAKFSVKVFGQSTLG